jgi:replicative DNA helicase
MSKTRDLLGMAILGSTAHDSLLALTAADFGSVAERAVFASLVGMIRNGQPIDVATVAARLDAAGQTPQLSMADLHDWVRDCPPPAMAAEYARLIRDETRVRLAQRATDQVARMLTDPQANDGLSEILAWQQRQIAELPAPYGDDAVDHTVAALLAEPEEAHEWIIPGLIARGERVVLTGHEGHGKSVLLRQIAACTAAGVHPWTGQASHTPARVLHVDVENSRPQTRRGYRRMRQIRDFLHGDWARNVTARIRPSGIDLIGRDGGWLHQVASECSPDLIVIGPAYKAMSGDPQRDRDVLAMLAALDDVRVRFNCAVIIEHHSPFGSADGPRTVRPYGSSVWQRWPEVGVGVREHKRDQADEFIRVTEAARTGQPPPPDWLDAVRWRPPREPRDWPSEIRWGAVNELPWQPAGEYRPTRQLEAA